MYLSRLVVKNFRSIESVDIHFENGKNVVIGKNNSGKSNIIKAVDIVLGEKSPDYHKSENIDQGDFHISKNKDGENEFADKILIICEITKSPNEELNQAEIMKCYGFHKYNETFTFGPDYDDIDKISSIDFDDLENNTQKTYINAKLLNQGRAADDLLHISRALFVFRAFLDDHDKVTKSLSFLYQTTTDDWTLCSRASIRNELIQSAIIKSFRDPQSELKISSWTWYGKLLKHLVGQADLSQIKNKFKEVGDLANKVFADAQDKIEAGALNVAFPGADLFFQFNEDFNTDLYKDCRIYIDDGVKSFIGEKGSGIQSATIIGLFSYYTQYVNSVSTSLLCIEEPELYLHPHARRVISDRLDDFVNLGSGNQVIITTHSCEFIKSINPHINIIKVEKNDTGGTIAKNQRIKDKSLLLDNNHNEVFFADKVIVTEGLDEYIVRWVAKEKCSENLDEKNISVVSVGGKDYMVKFIKMLCDLGVKCYIMADFDFLLRDLNNVDADKYKYLDAKGKERKNCHMSIENLGSEFWQQEYAGGTSIFNKIKTTRQKIKNKEEDNFYRAKSISEIKSSGVVELLRELRKNGIGVLDKDVEDFFLDDSYLNRYGKFDLESVFKISGYLIADSHSISDIIDTSNIEEFLKTVFSS